ncbi:hypothetical protein BKA93DRAFT_125469 [Sparassis latifolia]
MSLFRIPVELLLEILTLALDEHLCPTDVLRVNHTISELGQHILHSNLHFRSIGQLTVFARETTPLVCPPKSLVITLAGGSASFDVFLHLADALLRCKQSIDDEERKQDKPVPLDLLSLCLHSHTRNPHQKYIYDALTLANPKTFIWTGPDPDHHFSTAIVPAATFHLFCAIRTWTHIEHITLANLSFPSDQLGIHMPHDTPLLPVIPSLRTVCLGQATLLPPGAIAAMVCLPGQDSLERIRLVDAYRQSIWGPRLRRGDVERAAIALGVGDPHTVVEKVRRLVVCEAKNERIMGGDRVEGLTILI